jgi:hypothetical protein
LNTAKNIFINVAALIFSITGIVKLFSIAENAKYLAVRDPIIYFATTNNLYIFIGITEIFLSSFMILSTSRKAKFLVILWFSSNAALYRIFLLLLPERRPCPCLGNLAEWLKVPQSILDTILWAILVMLWTVSLVFLTTERNNAQHEDGLIVK